MSRRGAQRDGHRISRCRGQPLLDDKNQLIEGAQALYVGPDKVRVTREMDGATAR